MIVADSSPLIALASVHRLDLLRQVYGRIVVPDAVHEEVTRGADRPAASEIQAATWIERRTVADRQTVDVLRGSFGAGEAEAMTLALELPATLLLVDEKRARAEAVRRGIRITGVVGVVAEAKMRGLVHSAREVLDALAVFTPFRLAPGLRSQVLRELGED